MARECLSCRCRALAEKIDDHTNGRGMRVSAGEVKLLKTMTNVALGFVCDDEFGIIYREPVREAS